MHIFENVVNQQPILHYAFGNGLLRNTAENLGYDNCGNWVVKAV